MVTATRPGHIEELTAEQGRALVEERVQRALGIGLEEFIERWQAGAYGGLDDDPRVRELVMLLPIVGVSLGRGGKRA